MENIQNLDFIWFHEIFGLDFFKFSGSLWTYRIEYYPDLIIFSSFIGYRKEPSTEAELSNVLNNFTVKNCEIILTDRPRKFVFIIRGLHLTTVVERTFHTDSEDERLEKRPKSTFFGFFFSICRVKKKGPIVYFIEDRSPSRHKRRFCI